jgi:predicted DNA-binding transcriptional regulator AlpA
MPAAAEMTGMSETQIREKIAKGEFPRPIKLFESGRAIGFLEHELEAYLDERIAERDANTGHSEAEQARIEAAREGRRRKASAA